MNFNGRRSPDCGLTCRLPNQFQRLKRSMPSRRRVSHQTPSRSSSSHATRSSARLVCACTAPTAHPSSFATSATAASISCACQSRTEACHNGSGHARTASSATSRTRPGCRICSSVKRRRCSAWRRCAPLFLQHKAIHPCMRLSTFCGLGAPFFPVPFCRTKGKIWSRCMAL
jgi:hypothetical protein